MRKALVVLGLLAPVLASAATIVNGDFESGSMGWASTPTVAMTDISAYPQPPYTGIYTGGLKAAFFGWNDQSGGSISQTFATTMGQQYSVTFQYGAIALPSLQTMTASVTTDDLAATVLGSGNAAATGTLDLAAILSPYSFTFVGTGANVRLTFLDTSTLTSSVDGVLDNVVVTAVPEAGTISMMLGGLAMMGFVARRRF